MTIIGVSNEFEDARQIVLSKLKDCQALVMNYQAIKKLYDQLIPSGTQVLTDMPKAPNDASEVERWANKRFELSILMSRLLIEMNDEILRIMNALRQVKNNESAILIKYYIQGESMKDVAKHTNYSLRQCWTIHDAAIMTITDKGLLDGRLH